MFKSGTLICRTVNSAGPAACENTHIFTLHPAPETDTAPVLPVCVQAPLVIIHVHALNCIDGLHVLLARSGDITANFWENGAHHIQLSHTLLV